MPLTAVEVDLHDLEQVATGHSQAAAGLWRIRRRVHPGYVPNAQRAKQSRLRVSICANAGGVLNDLAEHKNTPGAVTEKPSKWRGFNLVTQMRAPADRQIKNKLTPVLD